MYSVAPQKTSSLCPFSVNTQCPPWFQIHPESTTILICNAMGRLVLPLIEFLINGIIQDLLVFYLFPLFSILFVKCIHVVCSSSLFFLFLYHSHYMNVSTFYFIHCTLDEHLSCFWLLAINYKVAMNFIVNVICHR